MDLKKIEVEKSKIDAKYGFEVQIAQYFLNYLVLKYQGNSDKKFFIFEGKNDTKKAKKMAKIPTKNRRISYRLL